MLSWVYLSVSPRLQPPSQLNSTFRLATFERLLLLFIVAAAAAAVRYHQAWSGEAVAPAEDSAVTIAAKPT
jgi:hypothetical protein